MCHEIVTVFSYVDIKANMYKVRLLFVELLFFVLQNKRKNSLVQMSVYLRAAHSNQSQNILRF